MTPPVVHIAGARPNFPKAAPVVKALERAGVDQLLIHTGQHYDETLSEIFFRQLALPEPDINLEVGSGTHASQTAAIMVGL
jgi:UDP-N-acetylglucosamine 2-epimerase (non-hydrolysing)